MSHHSLITSIVIDVPGDLHADDWAVLRDPAGLPFCVVQPPPGRFDPARAVEWPRHRA